MNGKVQGVGFRWFARETASRLGVRGWARNRPDGTVELEAEAEAATLAAFVRELETGHPYARVGAVASQGLPAREDPGEGFDIR